MSAGPYRSLYRTWRPRRFAEVLGQEHVTRTLRNAVREGRAGHAYLFCGPRGTGKTSVARILAQALNCLEPEGGEPCGSCPNCRQVADDRFLDIVEIDAASNRGIDEIRELREHVHYAPGAGRCKVYIVDEVHMLTDPAWNAFLKTLEEPPAGTVFVLATTDPHRVPLTALSRCQRFDFRPLSTAQIADRLAEICAREGAEVTSEALAAIACRAEGGMRDAISVLDQVLAFGDLRVDEADVAQILGVADREALAALVDAFDRRDVAGLLAALDACQDEGKDLLRLARDLMGAFRDRLVEVLGGPVRRPGEAEAAMAAIEALAAAETAMRRSGQPRLLLDVALLRLTQPAEAPEPRRRETEPVAPGGGAVAAPMVRGADGPPAPARRPASGPAAGGGGAGSRAPAHRDSDAGAPAAAARGAPAAAGHGGPAASGHGTPAAERRDLTLEAILGSWDRWVAEASPLVRDMLGRCRPLSLAGRRMTIETEAGYAHFAPKLKPALDRAVRRDFGLGLVFDFVEPPAQPGREPASGTSPEPPADPASAGDRAQAASGPGAAAAGGAGSAEPAVRSRGEPSPAEPAGADRRPVAPTGERSLVAEVLDVFGGGEVLSEEGGGAL